MALMKQMDRGLAYGADENDGPCVSGCRGKAREECHRRRRRHRCTSEEGKASIALKLKKRFDWPALCLSFSFAFDLCSLSFRERSQRGYVLYGTYIIGSTNVQRA